MVQIVAVTSLPPALRAACACIAAVIITLLLLMTPAHGAPVDGAAVRAAPPRAIIVRRGWHIDVGFAVSELEPPLGSIASDLPGARYFLVGFGDMHYLMARKHGSSTLAAALWPGRGIMLVTGLTSTPQQAFGAENAVELRLSAEDAHALQQSIWQAFTAKQGTAAVYRPGPYEGSLDRKSVV